jgi:alkaline phosphatase D
MQRRWLGALSIALLATAALPSVAVAGTAFTGVASGDMMTTDAILWTRTIDAATGQPSSVALTAQLAADPGFAKPLFTYKGKSDTARAGTVKIEATGLAGHTRYFYRFVAADGAVSPTGQFVTAPHDSDKVKTRLAFSGDVHGSWRPFPLTKDFGGLGLDYFVFLGDTMYETASTGSPAAADPFRDPKQALADYRRKYLENILPVKTGGMPGPQPMFAAQGNYTLLDNHELGNQQFQGGGAPSGSPPGKGVNPADPANDVTAGCALMNRTPGFAALEQAYLDYEPVRERRVRAPTDCRSNNTYQLYFAQRWGLNSIFINVDDRSYRDIRLEKPGGGDDTGPRADNPARTMLGAPQLKWLQQALLDAERRGIVWKIVAISSPIDRVGQFNGSDSGKSWIGGYRAERNLLLKFIADNHIRHVVFLSTDDHVNRVAELFYTGGTGPEQGPGQNHVPVPGAFTIVAGPIGAAGPSRFAQHDFATIKQAADKLTADQRQAGIDPIGLRPDFPGLKAVYREGDPAADTTRRPIDFYSPDTFNYVTLEISADGKSLMVDTWGIDAYPPNQFPEPSAVAPPRKILGFRIDAQ